MNLKNTSNEYVDALGMDFFEQCPKTVLAAIAVSFALIRCEDDFSKIRAEILEEWQNLAHAEIVSQKPPRNLTQASTPTSASTR